MYPIETERLILRQWQNQDYSKFAEINADKEVMRHFPSTYDRQQSDASIERFKRSINQHKFGFFAAQAKVDDEFIGFVGLNRVTENLPFFPAIEIGWRLAQRYWGYGYASEGARACLDYAFTSLAASEVVSMTPVSNLNSEKVMQRIGMRNSNDNFLHPAIDINNPLSEHVLYRITSDEWQQAGEA